jgi:hypothetical protein
MRERSTDGYPRIMVGLVGGALSVAALRLARLGSHRTRTG